MPQARILDHTIIKRLGKGTYGEVFLTKTQRFEKMVAVKCIPTSNLSKRGQDNLVSEIAILQKLGHQHIVMLHDFTWDSHKVYLIMEYCAGGDLSQFIREKRRLPENLVRHFLRQLALALQYLKLQNIVHMDLKPQNILLTSKTNPVLKVTDFGFAQWQKDSVSRNELRGTLLYMAPEVYCDGFYHPSCDLWSVGVILYECLFGLPPYASTDTQSLRTKIIKDEPIQLPASIPISENCAVLLMGLLKRNPTERLDHEAFFNHPFIDLQHAPVAESLDQAISLLRTAHHLSCQCQLAEAYENYTEGLSYLLTAIQCETTAAKRTELLQLADEYFTKAEQVKLRMREGENLKEPSLRVPVLNRSPPKRPPTLAQHEGTKCSGNSGPAVVVRKVQPVRHKPPRPVTYAGIDTKEREPMSAPLKLEPPVTPSTSQEGLLARLWKLFSMKSSEDMVPETPESTELTAGQSAKQTEAVERDFHEEESISGGQSQHLDHAVCNRALDSVSPQSVSENRPKQLRTPPAQPLLQRSPKRHHVGSPDSATSAGLGSTQPPSSEVAEATAAVGQPESGYDCVDASTASWSPTSTLVAGTLSGVPSVPGSDSSGTADPAREAPDSLIRLHALSMEMKLPGRATMAGPETVSQAAGHCPLEGTARLKDRPSVVGDRSRLSEIKRMCSPADACWPVILRLAEFYDLLHSNRLSEALSHLEHHFQRCLQLAKADSNETHRRALHSELKLVLDLAEGVRFRSPTTSSNTSDSLNSSPASSADSCQPVEVGTEVDENTEDNCTTC